MNLLHVTQGYYPAIGGTEWLIQKVSEEIIRLYHDQVTVFTTDCYNGLGFVRPFSPKMKAGWEELNGVKIRRFRVINSLGPILKLVQYAAYRLKLPFNEELRTWYSGPLVPGLRWQIQKYPADIIAAASFPLLHMYTALQAARASHRPCIFTGCLHPEDPWGFQRKLMHRAILDADGYIALTDYEADFVRQLGVDHQRIFVAGGGVDPAEFYGIQSEDAKQCIGIDPRAPLVGFVGQLGRHKGVDVLLKAMPLVWEKNPDIHLLIAGSLTSYQTSLEQIIQSWPEHYRAKLLTDYNFPNEKKGLLYNALDVFVYPSLYESFGIAFLEAWAARKPVIGCDKGAISSVVQDGKDGILLQERSAEELAMAILRLVENPGLAQSMGAMGYQKVMAKYTWPHIARLFREAYQSTDARFRS